MENENKNEFFKLGDIVQLEFYPFRDSHRTIVVPMWQTQPPMSIKTGEVIGVQEGSVLVKWDSPEQYKGDTVWVDNGRVQLVKQ
jgi:hypothetical protein